MSASDSYVEDVPARTGYEFFRNAPSIIYTVREKVADYFNFDKCRNIQQNTFKFNFYTPTIDTNVKRTKIVTADNIFLLDEINCYSTSGAEALYHSALQFKAQEFGAPKDGIEREGIFEMRGLGEFHTIGTLSDIYQKMKRHKFDPPRIIDKPFDLLHENNGALTACITVELVGRIVPTKYNEYGQLDYIMQTMMESDYT